MLFGGHDGELELRRKRDGATTLRGRFPYNRRAVLSDGGRHGKPKKEEFASRSFAYRVEDPNEDIHLLIGHDFGKPLASKSSGTLELTDTVEHLSFVATIAPELLDVSYVIDLLAQIDAQLVVGISPGFRIPPERAVKVAEKIEQEPVDPSRGMHGATIRTILEALLYELSLVTRPAYPGTQIALRNWEIADSGIVLPEPGPHRVLNRWRP